ncbi:ankyrin repeat-containing protein At5g02620-like [Pistacia vera]|uniref:ankyrin repeat-containing protein At5g02620-like n=1 Tax=Pistacia vera TaxID=55513 RepID=UPI001263147C|nr:ankyrin repeat-containing protein At5g02620-like [Pistacia vera]
MKLAKCLIEMDTSWESTGPVRYNIRPKIHRYGASPTVLAIEKEIMNQGKGERNDAEIPLFLAVKAGCRERVEEIFKTYPQAVGHIDDSGRTIIHVAIKYRQQKIFEFVVKEMEAFMPFLQVKNVIISIPQFLDHQNNMGLTAEALFAATNKDLRISSKEWLKRTAEGCSIVAVLIATVAFAAAYTIPGGPNQNTGFPVLMNHPFFTVFTISDILSLTFSLASVVTFLSILTSPFRLQDFKHSLPNKMTLGFTFLFLSVSMMMIAFGATVLLMIKKKESWERVMLYSFSFIPVGVFGLSYFPLYIRKSTSRALEYLTRKTKQLIPECFLVLLTKLYAFFCTCACTTPSASHSIP